MNALHDALADLARSISDGSDIDWRQLNTLARDDDERRLLNELHIVASIAALHRTFDAAVSNEADGEAMGRVVGRIEPAPIDKPSDEDPPPGNWGQFDLLGRVGDGSFGTVYRAHDTRLNREVAVKLLRDRPGSSEGLVERIVREGRAQARVHHPNVVTVYGVESHDGRIGLCMEFVRGRTLDVLLADNGPFSAREAALIGQEVSRALAAVHGAGLVHRDVKTQNVMREEGGRVILMDFGTGQALHSDPAASLRVAGTPLYLAPELLNGKPASVRSDIYSLGVLMYRLVTGRYPVQASSLDELREAHASHRMARLHDVRPTLPDGFVRVVERALDPDPLKRYESAGAMQAALADALGVAPDVTPSRASRSPRRAVIAAALAGIVLAGGVLGYRAWLTRAPSDSRSAVRAGSRTGGAVAPTATRSMAVLPFVNKTGSAALDYLGVGLADVLTARLTNARQVEVRTPRRTSNLREPDVDPVVAGRTIGVDTILTGAYEVDADIINLSYRLTDVGRNTQLAGSVLRLSLDDVVGIEQRLATLVVEGLNVTAPPQELSRMVTSPTQQNEALQAFLRSQYELDMFWKQPSGDRLREAERQLLLALDSDPRFALALVSLAKLRWLAAYNNYSDATSTLSAAETAAVRAIALDPTLGEAHAALALVAFQRGQMDVAREHLRDAFQQSPNAPMAYYAAGFYYMGKGLNDYSVYAFEHSQQLDPQLVRREIGQSYRYWANFERAAEQLQADLERNPEDLTTMKSVVGILVALGRVDEASRLHQTVLARAPKDPGALYLTALIAVTRGDASFSIDQWITQIAPVYSRDGGACANIAGVLAIAGRLDDAVAWLTKASELAMRNYEFVAGNPFYANLRSYPPFQRYLEGLREGWTREVERERADPLMLSFRGL